MSESADQPPEIVNLDGCTTHDLQKLEARYREAAHAYATLAQYAEATWRAIDARRAGLVHSAAMLERHAQTLYDQLPDWARW